MTASNETGSTLIGANYSVYTPHLPAGLSIPGCSARVEALDASLLKVLEEKARHAGLHLARIRSAPTMDLIFTEEHWPSSDYIDQGFGTGPLSFTVRKNAADRARNETGSSRLSTPRLPHPPSGLSSAESRNARKPIPKSRQWALRDWFCRAELIACDEPMALLAKTPSPADAPIGGYLHGQYP